MPIKEAALVAEGRSGVGDEDINTVARGVFMPETGLPSVRAAHPVPRCPLRYLTWRQHHFALSAGLAAGAGGVGTGLAWLAAVFTTFRALV